MNLVKMAGALVETAILLILGLYMFTLAGGEDYTQFMNPKFRWLTMITGVGLGLVGLHAMFTLRRMPEWTRIALFAVLFLLIGITALRSSPQETAAARLEPEPGAMVPWLELEGERYTKITTGEMFLLLRQGKADAAKLAAPYVMRGVVKRSPALDKLGLFALLRGNMICCVADSVAIGFYVKGGDLSSLDDGQWVRVYGRVEPVKTRAKLPDAPRMDGIFYSQAYPNAVLDARRIEPVPPPPSPYMFVIDAEEPYGY